MYSANDNLLSMANRTESQFKFQAMKNTEIILNGILPVHAKYNVRFSVPGLLRAADDRAVLN
jgi:hypothetical protein